MAEIVYQFWGPFGTLFDSQMMDLEIDTRETAQ